MSTASTTKSTGQSGSSHHQVGIKETITSLVIAFMLAFIFRGFIVEGFQIPTGSMAPTLLGKNIRFVSPHNGYSWTTGPWEMMAPRSGVPNKMQGVANALEVTDPMTGLAITETYKKLSSGDRVFVLKYLPVLHSPSRWDVVVFKYPGSHVNYIKRLVGLPGEQLAFVDGDLFTRKFVEGETGLSGWDEWAGGGWEVARKSERIQRVMFQDVSDSRFAPVKVDPGYRSPWDGVGSGWDGVRSGSSYVFSGAGDVGGAVLKWNGSRPITDRNSYNQIFAGFDLTASPLETVFSSKNYRAFYVSDIAMSADFEMGEDGTIVAMPMISARGHQFRAVVDAGAGTAAVEMREDVEGAGWTGIDTGSFASKSGSGVVGVEFWHVDQALWLFVDGELVCGGTESGGYSMSPLELAVAATGMSRGELESFGEITIVNEEGEEEVKKVDWTKKPGVLSRPELYREATIEWGMSGGGFTMHNVRVRRDISYKNMSHEVVFGVPVRGGHPEFFPTLMDKEYFMCGDNSARSLDSRLWADGAIMPWIEESISDRVGVVNEDLIVGKAFVVYWPSMLKEGKVAAPDIGRVRWIW